MNHRRKKKLSIAIPSSLLSETPHLREKTTIIGQIARTAAIFRVDHIYLYRDNPDESRLIRSILTYLETPQYLRKSLFKKKDELRYVGILPPLRTPHHPIEKSSLDLKVGDFREGVVIAREGEESIVDIGVEKPVRVIGRPPSIGSRTTILISEIKMELRGKFARKKDIKEYWGFEVQNINAGLNKVISCNTFDLKLGTSKNASYLKELEPQILERLSTATNILVAFGSPRKGLGEMLSNEKKSLSNVFDFTLNTIPSQGCVTVRTEEAIISTLAILNHLVS